LQGSIVRTGQSWKFNVTKYSKPLSDRHPVSGLVLFDERHIVVRSHANHAVQFVMRRCRVTPDVASVIAALAGLGSEVRS
jgi:hypothetical protein